MGKSESKAETPTRLYMIIIYNQKHGVAKFWEHNINSRSAANDMAGMMRETGDTGKVLCQTLQHQEPLAEDCPECQAAVDGLLSGLTETT